MQGAAPPAVWPFWQALSREEKDLIRQQTGVHRCAAGTLLLDKRSEGMGVLLVSSGRLRVFMIGSEGRTVSLCYLEKGECLVSGGLSPADTAALELLVEADRDSVIEAVPVSTVEYLLTHNRQMRQWIFHSMALFVSRMLHAVHQVLFTGLSQRLAEGLLILQRRQGNLLRITQERLAREISSSREVVSRELGAFAEKGLVRLGRGQIEILDADTLERIARDGERL